MFKAKVERSVHGGTQKIFEFANGYGASVVSHNYSYGGISGLWELAVLDQDGDLVYDTPVTDDVLGYLSEEEVEKHLQAIAALPKRAA